MVTVFSTCAPERYQNAELAAFTKLKGLEPFKGVDVL